MFRVLSRLLKNKNIPPDLPPNYIIQIHTDQGFSIGVDVPLRDLSVCSPVVYNNIKEGIRGQAEHRDPVLDYVRIEVGDIANAFVELYEKLGMKINDYNIITPDDKTWTEYHYLGDRDGGGEDVNHTESGSTSCSG